MKSVRDTALFMLIAASTSCGPPWRFTTRSEQPRPIEPAAGKALVVFMNAGKLGMGDVFYLVDQNRKFLGESIGASRVLVDVDPGKYTFYAVNKKDGSKVDAELAADKTYFVRVRVGFSGAVELVAFTERSEEWVNREDWLKNRTTEVVADRVAGQDFVDKYNWVEKNMAHADERVAAMTEEDRMKIAILKADDGLPR